MTDKPDFDPLPGDGLTRRNRRLIAQREGWPDGALDACEQIELEAPDWTIWWVPGDREVAAWPKQGYYAKRRLWHWTDARPEHMTGRKPLKEWVYGETPAELRATIAAEPRRPVLPP